MRIKQVTYKMRRDFAAILICESCQNEQELSSGYDDEYYCDQVIPNIKCNSCGKSRVELNTK